MSELPEEKGHDAHLSARDRLEILSMRIIDKVTAREVALAFSVSKTTVDNVVRKWHETNDVHEHLTGGPNLSYDDNDFYKLECLIDTHPAATAEALIEMMGSTAPQIDATTMRRYRHLLGYTRRKPAIWVIDTERSARERLKWAMLYRSADHSKWVFMDETTLCLRDTNELVWIKRGIRTPKHEVGTLKCAVHIWGIIWNTGSHFEFYEGSLTKTKYVAMLEKTLVPLQRKFRGRTVLHDMHPAHNSKLVKDWVSNHPIKLLYETPHSPQFNAIEEVWAWVKHGVKSKHPQNETELRAACEQAWKSVPRQHILNYISHASSMIKAAAKKNR
jgi:transposase